MRWQQFLAVLAAVVLVGSRAQAQTSDQTIRVGMRAFDEQTDTIAGIDLDSEEGGLGFFMRVANTEHLPVIINPNAPPGPCIAKARQWNNILDQVPEGSGRRNALLSVLTTMAMLQCSVSVTVDTTDQPGAHDILTIRPILE